MVRHNDSKDFCSRNDLKGRLYYELKKATQNPPWWISQILNLIVICINKYETIITYAIIHKIMAWKSLA